MKKVTRFILIVCSGLTLFFATTAFLLSDPKADFTKKSIRPNDKIYLSKISTKNRVDGAFKSALKFRHTDSNISSKAFYGQEISIRNNPLVDKILIGVTSNLISRIEIWKQDELVQIKELGFVSKMTWGETQTMVVDFYDSTNERYNGNSKISMRFYNGTGFFGDIGTINTDLTEFGDLSGDKSIEVFSKSLDSDSISEADFSDLEIWRNYKSFD